jgi:hypothetical protein
LSILQEFKNVEKSVADALDRLGYVDLSKIEQFTDLTYTEVANLSWIITRGVTLRKDPAFPFTEKVKIPTAKGMYEEKEVPLTYHFGESLDLLARNYMSAKVSMGRKSRLEVQGVAKSFGGGAYQEQRGIWAGIKSHLPFGGGGK